MTCCLAGLSASLMGYIGPGGGIALLGPLLGVLAAVFGALLMVALWPIRILWKKARAARKESPSTTAASSRS